MSTKQILEKYLKKNPKPFYSILENGDKADYFEGLDIEKPESLSPMEMELRIQADRVMFSLNKATSVLSVMAHIPYFMDENCQLLRQNLSSTEFDFVVYVIHSYNNPYQTLQQGELCTFIELYDTINRVKAVKTKMRSPEQDVPVDGNLAQVIHTIFTNTCLRDELSKAKNPEFIPYMAQFISDFEKLKAIAKLKLYITGTEEEAREKQLRQAYKSNVMLTAAIKDLEQQLQTQREQLGNELSKKVAIFEKYNNKIANIKEEFQISIEKNIHESEKKMMQQCLESEEKQAVLAEQAETITKQYEKLLEDHLSEEKKIRTKNMKTENQLQNWLTKYDQDLGDKQTEYEDLKKEYDVEKASIDELEDKLDEQTELYEKLMKEKHEEEEKLFQEIAYKLLINRSARVIQRAWRAYRERKSRKRRGKGKKAKEGKKAQGKK